MAIPTLAAAKVPTRRILSAAPSKPARRASGAVSLAVPIAILVVWQLACDGRLLPVGIIPTPVRVFSAWGTWAFGQPSTGLNPYSGTWIGNVQSSLWRIGRGYMVGALLGVPTGVLIGRSVIIRKLIDPIIQGLRPVPITAWLPVAIALFGIRDPSAIFLIALGAFYPIVVSTTQGARAVPETLTRVWGMMGMSWAQSVRMIILPYAAPSIFTGLRLGLGVAWTAVVVAEMVAVKSGLGYVLWDAYYIGRMDVVLADMVSIGLIGFFSDRILLWIEAYVLRWRAVHAS